MLGKFIHNRCCLIVKTGMQAIRGRRGVVFDAGTTLLLHFQSFYYAFY